MLINTSLEEFIELVDSKNPAPGGGSVSALASALGSALARMVGNLTMSKKAYLKLDSSLQNQFEENMNLLHKIETSLSELVDKDTLAFQEMMEAYRMEKESEEQIYIREIAIKKATIQGIEVPKKVVLESLSALENLQFFIDFGSKAAISDIGVGVLLLSSGIEGAILNMKINIPSLNDPLLQKEYLQQISQYRIQTEELKTILLKQIHEFLDKSMV